MPGVGNAAELAGVRAAGILRQCAGGARSSGWAGRHAHDRPGRVLSRVRPAGSFVLGSWRPRRVPPSPDRIFPRRAGPRAPGRVPGPGERRGAARHLGRLAGSGPLPARGAIRVICLEEIYGAGGPVDPAEVISRYAAATQEALADGYQGLRVSADVTDLVRAPDQHDAFARCEFLLERYSARHPLSAMCEYRRDLGDAVTQFACMHAAVPAGLTPFQVFACDDGAVGLLGEFDQACQAAFGAGLAAYPART
jgi:hypothetical protein